MQSEFEMSHMGELSYFLRLQIKQIKVDIFINQSKYAMKILKRFGIKTFKSKGTPMGTTIFLNKDKNAKSVDQNVYRYMIDSLLYITASRLDIIFSVYLCARYQFNPKKLHLKAVKRILRCINNIVNCS